MAKDQQGPRGQGGEQTQNSRQSARQGEHKSVGGKPTGTPPARSGIGSSQGQDRPQQPASGSERPSAGTPDHERGTRSQDVERGSSQDSLVNDSVGAFKERP